MKRFINATLTCAAALSIAPATAFAQSQAVTNAPVVIYAGPGDDYPVVAQLPGGVAVSVMGCVSGYMWCDVAVSDMRGWAYGGSLSYPYQGANVPVMTYGTVIGVPIVTFAIGNYWGSYYQNRPWYREEPRWAQHPPPHGPPPPHAPTTTGAGTPPPRQGPPPRAEGTAPVQGRPPAMHEGPPPVQVRPAPPREAPPPQHGAAMAPQGAPPPQQHGAPPPREGPPPQHGGPHGGESDH